jgi:type VI secretion system protein ImpL
LDLPWKRKAHSGNGEPQFPVGAGASPEEFQTRFNEALQRFRALPQHSGKGDPRYSLPWYLLLGPAQSGKSAMLSGSGLFSPLTSGAGGPTLNCDWWVSNRALVLDTAGRYAFAADPVRDRGEWFRLLSMIRRYRSREPLSGMIVALAADELAGGADEKLRNEGGKLRERIEEAFQQLGHGFPLYVVVTKCDLIEGFVDFFTVMPERTLNEAVGYVAEVPAAGTVPGGEAAQLQSGFHSVYERMHFIRMSILNGQVAPPLLRPVFCFPEELRALENPLLRVAEPLLNADVRYHTPLFRGVFIASALQAGMPFSTLRRQLGVNAPPAPLEGRTQRAYFLHDLFERILPRDHGLGTSAISKSAA